MSIFIKAATPESIETSAEWLSNRAKSLRRNGQQLSADMAERKSFLLFKRAHDLRTAIREGFVSPVRNLGDMQEAA